MLGEAIGVKPIVRLLVEDEDGHKEEVAVLHTSPTSNYAQLLVH